MLALYRALTDAGLPLIRLVLARRMRRGREDAERFAERMGVSPYEHARRLYYDTLVYDAPTLRHLIDTFGVRTLCLGTDFPFDIHERHPVEAVAALKLTDGEVKLLHHDNAARFLGETNL